MILKKYVYDFFISNEYYDEWDNLQSQVQEYMKRNEIKKWKYIILDEIVFNASNSQNNNCFKNNKELELHDLAYDHCS